MSMCMLKKQRPQRILSLPDIAHKMGKLGICPKVALQGIPEWNVMARGMTVVRAHLETADGGASYGDLKEAARSAGIPYHRADGSKKNKKVLQRDLSRTVALARDTGMRKRTIHELEVSVRAAGGSPLSYTTVQGRRVRRRMTRSAMEQYAQV
jgi:hypothetical protein